jgi:UDP-glucose:glycoprotein glucosyltransferase
VALDLKKTDYLAVDDRFQHNPADKSDQQTETSEVVDPVSVLIRNYPENPSTPDAGTPLSEEELLGMYYF